MDTLRGGLSQNPGVEKTPSGHPGRPRGRIFRPGWPKNRTKARIKCTARRITSFRRDIGRSRNGERAENTAGSGVFIRGRYSAPSKCQVRPMSGLVSQKRAPPFCPTNEPDSKLSWHCWASFLQFLHPHNCRFVMPPKDCILRIPQFIYMGRMHMEGQCCATC